MDVKADTGLLSLITIAQYHQLPAEEPQIAHQFGVPAEVFTNTEIIRAAKSLGFKTRESKSSFEKLSSSILPTIAQSKSGDYFILAKVAQSTESSEGKVLVLFPGKTQPEQLSQAEELDKVRDLNIKQRLISPVNSVVQKLALHHFWCRQRSTNPHKNSTEKPAVGSKDLVRKQRYRVCLSRTVGRDQSAYLPLY